jgi:hypothetical protein
MRYVKHTAQFVMLSLINFRLPLETWRTDGRPRMFRPLCAGGDGAARRPYHHYSCAMALSIAVNNWPIVASVSSPMFETRKVVPLIFP